MGKTSTASKRKYNEKAYDRLTFVVPKGRKAYLQSEAESKGESVSSYITKALFDRLGIASWDELDAKP